MSLPEASVDGPTNVSSRCFITTLSLRFLCLLAGVCFDALHAEVCVWSSPLEAEEEGGRAVTQELVPR